MPELPEVETTRRGIEPWLVGRRIESLNTYPNARDALRGGLEDLRNHLGW